jgi:hypothetical protein
VFGQKLYAVDFLHPRQAFDKLRVFRREYFPLTPLTPFVTMWNVERCRALRAVQQQVSMRRFEAAEIVEFVSLAEAHVSGRT